MENTATAVTGHRNQHTKEPGAHRVNGSGPDTHGARSRRGAGLAFPGRGGAAVRAQSYCCISQRLAPQRN